MENTDIFNLDENTFSDPELTQEDFILKAKDVLMKIDSSYASCWYDNPVSDEDLPSCNRCGGFLYIEQGGETVDCTVCNGTGVDKGDKLFDSNKFSELMENIMFNYSDFYELLSCKIKRS